MTRYDPNTVPIMQNWSKWPFHTKESRGVEINAAPPSLLSAILFFLPHFCFTIPCLFKLQWLCTCLHDICSGQKKKKGKPAAYQINLTSVHKAIFLHIPTRRNAFIRSHVVFPSSCVCLFFACLGLFFLYHTCVATPPPPTPQAVSARRLQDTSAMLKPARRDRWREQGQTSLVISEGAGTGSHHKG